MSPVVWIRIGAVLGGLGVAIGAFGAHGLKGRFPESSADAARMLEIFETAARYQMYHALALLAVGLIGLSGRHGTALNVAGWSFLVGTLIFSGSLYALVLTGQKWLGAITPIGGTAFIVGWIALAMASLAIAGKPADPFS